MRKPKMHFEQVPLEMVRKIVQKQTELEKTAPAPLKTDEKKLEENALELNPVPVKSAR